MALWRFVLLSREVSDRTGTVAAVVTPRRQGQPLAKSRAFRYGANRSP